MREHRVPVLIAVENAAVRHDIAHALTQAGFEVWQAQEYDEAVAMLHASARRLVMVISPELVRVLAFAASDRRMAHHHVYIALRPPGATRGEQICESLPCLTLSTLAAPTAEELIQAVTKAARLLGSDPATFRELVTR